LYAAELHWRPKNIRPFDSVGVEMKLTDVIVSSADGAIAAKLAASLSPHLSAVSIGLSFEQTRDAIARHRATGAVIDLETCDLGQVEQLCREFPATRIVCTHRLADEQMWVAALTAGAADCCYDADIASILRAVGQAAAPAARRTAA
jgi:hypothetical protein